MAQDQPIGFVQLSHLALSLDAYMAFMAVLANIIGVMFWRLKAVSRDRHKA